ncbi:DUF4855 domain-containing protein, partial [Paenibacillus thermotolerans]
MTNMQQLGYLSPSAFSIQNHVVVLPCGGLSAQDVLLWTETDLEKYVSYFSKALAVDRMFGGFVFHGLSVGKDRFLHPLFVGFGEPSNKNDWLRWIESLFAPNANLYSLFEIVRRHGCPSLDIWVSIPYPHPSQSSFGIVGGSNLDFGSEEHRYQAVVWWIEQFIRCWKTDYRLEENLNFRGFLWQREAVDGIDESLVKRVNQYIKSKGFYSMWLPNFGSYGYNKCNELGFDITAMGSNYYGNTPCDYNWIHHACKFARVHHTGLQITYGKGLIYSEHHLSDYLNVMLLNKAIQDCFFVYELPNQTMNDIYRENNLDYKRLYSFIKGTYKKTTYPGIK